MINISKLIYDLINNFEDVYGENTNYNHGSIITLSSVKLGLRFLKENNPELYDKINTKLKINDKVNWSRHD